MPGHRDITDAHPRLQKVWHWVQAEWPRRYPERPVPFLTEVYRSRDVQRAYYAQGREKLANVNSLRRAVGLAPLSEDDNRRKVTWAMAGQSKHQVLPAEAIDIMFAQGKKLLDDHYLYKDLADLVHEYDPGIRWGGDWDGDGRTDDERKPDRPHFEI